MASEGIRHLPTSAEEVEQLLRRYRRHMRDAGLGERDDDARYCTYFEAGLVMAKLAVRAHGWRVAGAHMNHHTLIKLSRSVLGRDAERFTSMLENARTKRNHATYDEAGTISHTEVKEIESTVLAFELLVTDWIGRNHPGLLPPQLPL